MKTVHRLLLSASAFLLSATTALASDLPLKKVDGILVNGSGMTVYSFDKDAAGSGKSVCVAACATIWPPVAAMSDSVAAPYSVVTRDDGVKQLAYKGKPIYLYAADQVPGQRNGDNLKGIWHVVKD